MTTFPNSPRVLKGALVGVDPASPIPTVVIFQYNPDTLTRQFHGTCRRPEPVTAVAAR